MERWWRVVAAYRGLALAYAVAVAAAGAPRYQHPAVGAATLAGVAAWSVAVTIWSLRRGGLPDPALVLDVAVAVAAVALTPAAVAHHDIVHGAATLPGPWAAAPVLSVAVARGPAGGLLAALVVAAADIGERGAVTQNTVYGAVLLLLAGGLGGYVVRLSRRAEEATAAAARLEAATEERERLARDIHDSVLQVLALVARRGLALGGEAAELARLAGEQEVALRALVATPPAHVDASGEIDVRALLEPLAADRVTVSCPAEPVRLPERTARELVAATKAALHNVVQHAGEAAHAWVLVEDETGAVVVSVRDDGVGMDAGRLDAARQDGRLGVQQSILGRVHAVGGTATIDSAPGRGTEVELRVPRG